MWVGTAGILASRRSKAASHALRSCLQKAILTALVHCCIRFRQSVNHVVKVEHIDQTTTDDDENSQSVADEP